jgi:ferric-dicitrate binding protein FerR (iron transport regulator)
LRGSVELKSKKENRTIVVNEGYRTAVAKDGKLLEPQKIDIANLERWWEK